MKRGYTAAFHVTKHEKDTLYESESEPYTVEQYSRNNWYRCSCPGFVNYHHCKHQSIVNEFVQQGKVGTGSLYDYDSKRWSNQFVDVPEEEYDEFE
jgi:hypothetical protein